ncbi:hypothetical protein BAMA_06375 [Bacillus manliponensis]|uniref:Group-specific protein n=1 Tax=Bacillus manliponensis TaxID=574376 RepID=A0A073JV45_9BACI|nr:hypothetical protein [Bacillus manliponensis]KEK18185.1 hypothetical protein BAMA_06375 [Bacillus manliponensis]
MSGPLLLSVIILSSLMIWLTIYFQQEDTNQESVQDKVRLVFPVFILTIAVSFALNKNDYVAIFTSLCTTILLVTVLYYVMKDYLQK